MKFNLVNVVATCVALAFVPVDAFQVRLQNSCPDVLRVLHVVRGDTNFSARNPIAPGHNATYQFRGPYTRGADNILLFGRGNKVPKNVDDNTVLRFEYEYQPDFVQSLLYAGASTQFQNVNVKIKNLSTGKSYMCKNPCCTGFCPQGDDDIPFGASTSDVILVNPCGK